MLFPRPFGTTTPEQVPCPRRTGVSLARVAGFDRSERYFVRCVQRMHVVFEPREDTPFACTTRWRSRGSPFSARSVSGTARAARRGSPTSRSRAVRTPRTVGGADRSECDRPLEGRLRVRGGRVVTRRRAATGLPGYGAPGCSACSRCSRTDLESGLCSARGWSAASEASRAGSWCSFRPASRPRIAGSGRPSGRPSSHVEGLWPLLLLSLTLDSPRRSSRSRGAGDPGMRYGDVTNLGSPANLLGVMRRVTRASA